MKPNTALGLLASGLALGLGSLPGGSPRRRLAWRALALLPFLLGVATLVEYLAEVDLGIDEILFRDDPGAVRTPFPGRMATVTALSFVLSSAALLGLETGNRPVRLLTDALALIIVLLALLGLLGYLYEVEYLSGVLGYSGFALHTAVALSILGLSILVTRPGEGLLAPFASPTPAGAWGRRLLAAVAVVPVALGWLRLEGQRAGLYGTDFGTSLYAATMVLLLAGVVYAGTASLVREEAIRRGVQEDLRRAKEAAEAAGRELESFSYSVSHDLRAPLRGIDGFSQALLEDHADRLDDRGRDHLQRVRAAAQRMGQLIDDLLDLSRVGRAELARERVDITALARAVAADLARGAPGRSIEWIIEDGLEAEGDPRLLRLVLENLLGNAVKYSGLKPSARIGFGAEGAGPGRVFTVRDEGAGFDMAHAGRLFEPFQRLHHGREFPGTGVGLATVRRVVTRHGGRVWAEGRPGEGAAFHFTLGGGERGAGPREGGRNVKEEA
ncbi:MAG: hypothetical protein HUU06_01175 [Planctomycetaceae bacterium]|nr:hypothetical protein [Planctomycetaceae bacterium]